MRYPIKIIQSAKTRQWHCNILGKNGKVLFTSEPVKRKKFALGTAMALAKVLAVDVADRIRYFPAPKTKRVAITDAHD